MKAISLTIVTTLLIVLGFTKTTNAATATIDNAIVLNDVKGINKIEVHGNVELYVSDGSADEVKVYNKYYSESALVQNKNGVLRISSYKSEKLVVWVTASDLRAIAAYDNSEVRSFGNLSKIEFDVELHNNASAKLNLDAYSANLNIFDNAQALLKGNAEQFSLNHNLVSKVNNNNFAVANYNEKTIYSTPAASKEDMVYGL